MSQKILIIGGGISGVTLAHFAMKAGFEVTVYDEFTQTSPSKVAAGVINPLSMSRKKVIWKGAEFAKAAWHFYRNIDNGFVAKEKMFFRCKSQKECNDWEVSNAAERGFLTFVPKSTPFGGFEINYSGWIDSRKYIETLDDINLVVKNESINLSQDLSELSQKFDHIVLATGYKGIGEFTTHYRSDLFKPVLGDVLTVKLTNAERFMHYEGIFVIPIEGTDLCKLGSTYINEFESTIALEENRNLLLNKAKLQGIQVLEVVKHECAARPASFDRFPLIGKMDALKNLYLFSGMGSRALLYAPLMAQQLLDLLQNNIPVWKEVDIVRGVRKG